MAKRRQATIASKAKQARNLKAKGPKEAKTNGEEITNGKPLAKDVTLKSKVAENSSIPKKIAKIFTNGSHSDDVSPTKALLNRTHSDLESLDFDSKSVSSRGILWNYKITCWNVDGLRACVKKNGLEFIHKEIPDVMCFQEIKSESHKIPSLTDLKHYNAYWSSAVKAGYSGTGILSKDKPLNVRMGMGLDEHDQEGRVMTVEYEKFFLVNVYVPNAGAKLIRLEYRMEWDRVFRRYLVELDGRKPVIACGDFNVAHQEIDLKNPKTNQKSAGFTKEERDGFTELLASGFTDTFRHLYPDLKDRYTYWSYRFDARAKNIGWRLDYFLVSNRLMAHVCDNVIRKDIYGSDHCPISLLLELD